LTDHTQIDGNFYQYTLIECRFGLASNSSISKWQKGKTLRDIIAVFIFLITANCAQAQPAASPYPIVRGYLSVVNPIVIFNKHGGTFNFSPSYTVGFPCGVNILKSNRFGFSFEVTPYLNFADSLSKVTNFLFHPGLMLRYAKGFTFIARLAFETLGRYGATAIFNKIVIRSKTNSYFIAVPVALRFGAHQPGSIGTGIQLGITF
jgi:hypothetical protein